MITKVQKWGNSLGLRIPKACAQDAEIEEGTAVDIRVKDGQLIIAPVTDEVYSLEALLRQITSHNLHREIDTGDPLGKENW